MIKSKIKNPSVLWQSPKTLGRVFLVTAGWLFVSGCQTNSSPTTPAPLLTQSPQAESSAALFDGRTLKGWRLVDFAGGGPVEVVSNLVVVSMGATLTGLTYTNPVPPFDYEISLSAARLEGNDFFCGLTFPVGESFCTLILGGWGGAVVGLSSIDGADASMNETTQYHRFERDRFYPVRLRVTRRAITVWLDEKRIIEQPLAGHTISLRPGEIELCAPLGIATWQTTAALRDIRLTILPDAGE